MKREFIFSITLHLAIIAMVLFSAPFSIKPKQFDYDQVIQVRAVSMPQNEAPSQADFIEKPAIPEPSVVDEPEEITLDDPTSKDEPEVIEKPEEKPKPKTEKKKPTRQENTKKPSESTEQSTGTPEGSKEVEPSQGAGSPFGTATVDNTSFDYPYWFDQAFNKLAYNFKSPIQVNYDIVCIVKFDVIKSGKVYNVEVESSSGIPAFDEACLEAIQKSSPLPPFPKDFQYEIIGVTVPFKNQ